MTGTRATRSAARVLCALALLGVACGDEPSISPRPADDAGAAPPSPHLVLQPSGSALHACGKSAEVSLAIANTGGAELRWTGIASGVDGVTLEPKAGFLTPQEEVVLHLGVPAQTTGPTSTVTVAIESNDPAGRHVERRFEVRRSGAVLSLDSKGVDFGLVPVGIAPPPQTVVLHNEGNEPASVAPYQADGFNITWEQPSLAPAASMKGTVTFLGAQQVGTFTKVAAITTPNECARAPELIVHAASVDGVVGASPGALDLGAIACGASTPAVGTITIYNTSKQWFTANAIATGTNVDLTVYPAKIIISGESQETFTVTMANVPSTAPLQQGYFSGSVEITTTAPKDTPHTIPVTASPKGGLVVLTTPAQVDFKKRALSAAPAVMTVGVQNFGNAPVTLDGAIAAPFSVPSPVTINPGASVAFAVQHTSRPDDLGRDLSEPLSFVTQDALCAPLPNTVTVAAHVWEKATRASVARPYSQGLEHACAIGASGHVYCWGDNSRYQLADNGPASALPQLIRNLPDASFVSSSRATSCAVTKLGEVWCWGDDANGVLAMGWAGGGGGAHKIPGINDATSVAVGFAACALRSGGSVTCWGKLGYVGDGSTYSGAVTLPVPVSNLSDAKAIDGLDEHMCALRNNGTIVCWGQDGYTSFGGSGVMIARTPVSVPGVTGAYELSATELGACYLTNTYRGCWGLLANGTVSNTVARDGLSFWSGLSAMGGARCWINESYEIECGGMNPSGVLGTGPGGNTWGTNVIGPGSFVSIGPEYGLGVSDVGTLLQWGRLLKTNTIVKPTPVPGFDP